MSTINGVRLIGAIARTSVTAAEVQAYLGVQEHIAGFQQAVRLRGQIERLLLANGGMMVLAGSTLAMKEVADASSVGTGGLLAGMLGLPGMRSTLLASSIAMGAIAASASGSATLINNPIALAEMVASPASMAYLAANPTNFVMSSAASAAILNSATALAAMFGSSPARVAMATSSVFIQALQGNAFAKNWLLANKKLTVTAQAPDGVVGTFQRIANTPSRILVLQVRTDSPLTGRAFEFSTRLAGQTGTVVSSSTYVAYVAVLSNPSYDLDGPQTSAAMAPIIDYVDMT